MGLRDSSNEKIEDRKLKMTDNTSNKINRKKIDKIIISSSDLIASLTSMTPEMEKTIDKIILNSEYFPKFMVG